MNLKEHLDLSNPNVFIYYNTFTKNRQLNAENGLYLFFREGKLFGQMAIRDVITRVKFPTMIHTHLRAVIRIFETFGGHIKLPVEYRSPPIIYVHNQNARKWLESGNYKSFNFDTEPTKIKLFTFINTFSPEFRHYDITAKPYCLLRELCLEQTIKMKLMQKKRFVSWNRL